MEKTIQVKKGVRGIPRIIQNILCKSGYYLPTQFNKPPSNAYMYHYFEIITLIIYAVLTVCDIANVALDGIRAYALWLLSTVTIVCTQAYKIAMGKRKVAHKNNRRHINKLSDRFFVFNEYIYTRPLIVEVISMIVAIILLLCIMVFAKVENIMVAISIGVMLRWVLYFLSLWNCMVLCIENFAEFYEASDICRMKE